MSKRFYILSLACCFSLLEAVAQKRGLLIHSYSPSFRAGSVKNFLTDINDHSGVTLEYTSGNIDTGKVITLTGNPSTLGAVLQQVLKDQKVSVIEKNNKLILISSAITLPENALLSLYSVYGIIKEAGSGEPLVEATIQENYLHRSTLANEHGYYTLLLPEGKHVLYISYVGHQIQKLELNVTSDLHIDVRLEPSNNIDEVVVSSDNKSRKEASGMHTEEELYSSIQVGPDALSALYMQPGVKNIPEITNGTLVRGGSPDQNVFLLDGNTIFNPTHLLGSISIVDKTALKYAQLYKSNFPARYGGRLSSVQDIVTRNGNMEEWKGEANAGLMAGSLTIEGPLKKDKASIMLSARQSWINPILELLNAGIQINFYDLHFKYTQLIGEKDKLMVNVYAGHDKLLLQKDNTNNQQRWGNKAASLNWNHLLGARAFINSSVHVSSYNNIAGFRYSLYDSTGAPVQKRIYNTFSSIENYRAQTSVEFTISNTLRLNAGAAASHTRTKPFDTNISNDFAGNPEAFTPVPPLSFSEVMLFYENEIKAGRFFIRPGIHISHSQYKDFHYTSWQPRLYAVYQLHGGHQLSFSYNHMMQFMHLVTNPYLGINSDVWIPSTKLIHPEESNMVNAGYTYRDKKKLAIGIEAYYKLMQHVTNNAEGTNLFLNNDSWEDNIQSGKGWSYGVELKARKKAKRWETYLSYALAWNWRQFSTINGGEKFPFKYDRRHDLNLAVNYHYNERWLFSTVWTFASGDVFTLPNQVYPDFDDAQQIADPLAPSQYRLIYHSSAVNQYRTLPYHRLDISASYHHYLRPAIPTVLTFGIYNIYGSPNQYVYDLEGTLGKRSLIVTTRYDFFNVIPYVSYNIKF